MVRTTSRVAKPKAFHPLSQPLRGCSSSSSSKIVKSPHLCHLAHGGGRFFYNLSVPSLKVTFFSAELYASSTSCNIFERKMLLRSKLFFMSKAGGKSVAGTTFTLSGEISPGLGQFFFLLYKKKPNLGIFFYLASNAKSILSFQFC